METTRQLVHQSDLVFFYRDCLDGTLRGYMLASQKDGEKEGKCYCVMHVRGTHVIYNSVNPCSLVDLTHPSL